MLCTEVSHTRCTASLKHTGKWQQTTKPTRHVSPQLNYLFAQENFVATKKTDLLFLNKTITFELFVKCNCFEQSTWWQTRSGVERGAFKTDLGRLTDGWSNDSRFYGAEPQIARQRRPKNKFNLIQNTCYDFYNTHFANFLFLTHSTMFALVKD